MSCITTKFIITLYCFKHIFLCGTTELVFCVLTARKLEDYCLVSSVHVSQETGNGPDHCCTLVMCPVLYHPAAGCWPLCGVACWLWLVTEFSGFMCGAGLLSEECVMLSFTQFHTKHTIYPNTTIDFPTHPSLDNFM